jgi:hypothetical protein
MTNTLSPRSFTIRTTAPLGRTTRVSSDSVWPLKRVDGKRWSDLQPEYRKKVLTENAVKESM